MDVECAAGSTAIATLDEAGNEAARRTFSCSTRRWQPRSTTRLKAEEAAPGFRLARSPQLRR
jgi:hypothetical protein